jgi:hypothetical protein
VNLEHCIHLKRLVKLVLAALEPRVEIQGPHRPDRHLPVLPADGLWILRNKTMMMLMTDVVVGKDEEGYLAASRKIPIP